MGRLRHLLLQQEGLVGTRLSHCNVSMQASIGCGPGRACWAASKAYRHAASRACWLRLAVRHSSTQDSGRMGCPCSRGEPHARLAQTHATLPLQVEQYGVCSRDSSDDITSRAGKGVVL